MSVGAQALALLRHRPYALGDDRDDVALGVLSVRCRPDEVVEFGVGEAQVHMPVPRIEAEDVDVVMSRSAHRCPAHAPSPGCADLRYFHDRPDRNRSVRGVRVCAGRGARTICCPVYSSVGRLIQAAQPDRSWPDIVIFDS